LTFNQAISTCAYGLAVAALLAEFFFFQYNKSHLLVRTAGKVPSGFSGRRYLYGFDDLYLSR
jgi:hypothetical protein